MKKVLLALCFALFVFDCLSQTPAPPARLKYFGYAIVDCGLDDPNDSGTLTNYTTQVDTFSNVAEMCANNPTDTIISRVNLMNAHCMKPILAISNIFIYLANNNGPSGSNYDLYTNYQARWDSFKVLNASVLNAQQIEMFYVCDEPTWNGVNFSELSTICNTIKADFPNIPLSFVEAYTEVANIQVPTNVTYFGFDHYGIYDVSTDVNYLAWLDTLEGKMSAPNQKIILVFDEEWNAGYWPGTFTQDSMETVFRNYYKLALQDTNVAALVGFTWPGIAPGWLGAQSLPQHVIDASVEIGQLIKANYNPCTGGIKNEEYTIKLDVFPNPTRDELNFTLSGESERMHLFMYDNLGRMTKETNFTEEKLTISVSDLAPGIYSYRLTNKLGIIVGSGKFVKE